MPTPLSSMFVSPVSRLRALVAVLLAVLTVPAVANGPQLDPELPVYEPRAQVAGDLRVMGSDTMGNLVGLWVQELNRHHPGVRVQVEAKGSSTAPPALLENQAQFGAMSRAMDPSEVDRFVEEFGYEPTRLRVAIDCVAVFVNKDCPLDEIGLDQIKALFSVSGGDLTWGDLGVKDPAWAGRSVELYGRNSASGTYKFFKKIAMEGEDFKPTVKEAPGSAGVINAVATDRFGIGYSDVGFATPSAKGLKVAFETGEDAFAPTADAANAGDYPLARFLYVYMNYDSLDDIDPLRAEFVRLIYSRQGQEAVIKDGAFPVSASVAKTDLAQLGLELGEPKESHASGAEHDDEHDDVQSHHSHGG